MRTKGITAIGIVLLMAAATGAPAAEMADLDELRERAQGLGDKVSDLERELAGLNESRDQLEYEIAESSAAIGLLEMDVNEAEVAYDEALTRYIDRAVAAYKAGPGQDLALLLSTTTIDDFYFVAEAQRRAASDDREALAALQSAADAAQKGQAEIDKRKQDSCWQGDARVEAVSSEIEASLAERTIALDLMTQEVTRLEHEARLAVEEAAQPSTALADLLQPSGPAPGIPDGFVGTGVRFSGVASWYGPGFEGNSTANGDIFDPDLFTAASRDLPFGTWLYVTHAGRGVVVLVNDRGPYIDDRVLDLSQAAAEAVGISGLGWIDAEILIKTD